MSNIIIRFIADHFADTDQVIHDAIVSALPDAGDAVIGKMQSNVPVDTGSLQAGFYLVSRQNDTYNDAVSAAQAVNPDVRILDECDAPEVDTIARLGNVAEHSVYIEFGTVNMPAQPYFFSTADQMHDELVDIFAQAVNEAINGM